MRSPGRRRPLRRAVAEPPEGVELEGVADRATYVGSPEHKDVASFAGAPMPRTDATLCPRELNGRKAVLVRWLRQAIRAGHVGGMWEGDFPRYAWYEDGQGQWYEARLTNRELGQYKGYPLRDSEKPDLGS